MAITKVTRHNTPAFQATLASTQNITTATLTKVLFATEGYDTDGKFASNKFTPTVAGTYNFHIVLTLDDLEDAKSLSAYLYKNGSAISGAISRVTSSVTDKVSVTLNWTDIYVYHNIGSTEELRTDYATVFFAYRVIT